MFKKTLDQWTMGYDGVHGDASNLDEITVFL